MKWISKIPKKKIKYKLKPPLKNSIKKEIND